MGVFLVAAVPWDIVIWSCLTMAFVMGVIVLILYIISAKNMRKKRTELAKVHTELKVGSKVMFGGGIYGTVTKMDEEVVNVEIAKGTIIRVSRYGIQSVD